MRMKRNRHVARISPNGRPAADPNNPKIATKGVSLSRRQAAWLDKAASTLGTSRSFLIQLALDRLISSTSRQPAEPEPEKPKKRMTP